MTDPLTTTLAILGGITFYYGPAFEGHTLHCDYPTLVYDCATWEAEPWAAFPLEWFKDGRFQCGDRVKLMFRSGRVMWVRALDACPGCLHSRIYDTGRPFIADVPRCWRNKEPTGTGRIWNWDLALRQRQQFEFRSQYH